MLPGTQVKTIVAYVTDYVTKSKLTTEIFFDTVRTVLGRNADSLSDDGLYREDLARLLVVKIVNALAASSETGGPAVCAYLLGYPDHYTDHVFRTFYWQPYCREVLWCFATGDARRDESQDRVMLGLEQTKVVKIDKVTNYTHRPVHFSDWTLYDYMRFTDARRLPRKHSRSQAAVEANDDPESAASQGQEEFDGK